MARCLIDFQLFGFTPSAILCLLELKIYVSAVYFLHAYHETPKLAIPPFQRIVLVADNS